MSIITNRVMIDTYGRYQHVAKPFLFSIYGCSLSKNCGQERSLEKMCSEMQFFLYSQLKLSQMITIVLLQ